MPLQDFHATKSEHPSRAPKRRNEAGVWWRRHDEYDKR